MNEEDISIKLEKHETKDIVDKHINGSLTVVWRDWDKIVKNEPKMVSGRAIISRMEGEFTRLRQIYGNLITLYGIDGDTDWENRQTRFVKPLYTDEVMKIKFTISDKKELDDEFGLIAVDYEGLDGEGNTIVTSKKNLYRIKKNPPSNL